jgi:hypothetical protein
VVNLARHGSGKLGLVAWGLVACASSGTTGRRNTPSATSPAASVPAIQASQRAPEQALAGWIARGQPLYVSAPSSSDTSCAPLAVVPDPETQTAGRWGESYRFALAAGWLTVNRDQPADKQRFTSAARAELDRTCRQSFAVTGAGDASVRIGGSAVFRDQGSCLASRGKYKPLHMQCEDVLATLPNPTATAAWNGLYQRLASGLGLSIGGDSGCRLDFGLDGRAAAERFSPRPLHVASGWVRAGMQDRTSSLFAFDFYPGANRVWLSPVSPGAGGPLWITVANSASSGPAKEGASWAQSICQAIVDRKVESSDTTGRSGEALLLDRFSGNPAGVVLHVPTATESGLRCEALAWRALDGGHRGLIGTPDAIALSGSGGTQRGPHIASYEILEGALTVVGDWAEISYSEDSPARGDGHGCRQRIPMVAGDEVSLRMGDSRWFFRREDCERALGQVAPTELRCPVLSDEAPLRGIAHTFMGQHRVFRRSPGSLCEPLVVRSRSVSESEWGAPRAGEIRMPGDLKISFQIFGTRWLWLGSPDGASGGRVLPLRVEGGDPDPREAKMGEMPPETIHWGDQVWFPSLASCEAGR